MCQFISLAVSCLSCRLWTENTQKRKLSGQFKYEFLIIVLGADNTHLFCFLLFIYLFFSVFVNQVILSFFFQILITPTFFFLLIFAPSAMLLNGFFCSKSITEKKQTPTFFLMTCYCQCHSLFTILTVQQIM